MTQRLSLWQSEERDSRELAALLVAAGVEASHRWDPRQQLWRIDAHLTGRCHVRALVHALRAVHDPPRTRGASDASIAASKAIPRHRGRIPDAGELSPWAVDCSTCGPVILTGEELTRQRSGPMPWACPQCGAIAARIPATLGAAPDLGGTPNG